MLLSGCLQYKRTLIVHWLLILMIAFAPWVLGAESKAPNLKPGGICLVHDSKSWVVAKFLCYVQVDEVEFLRNEKGEIVSRSIRRMDISDSNPVDDGKLYAKLDVCVRLFATKQEAEAFVEKMEIGKEIWIKDVIRNPKQLTLHSVK